MLLLRHAQAIRYNASRRRRRRRRRRCRRRRTFRCVAEGASSPLLLPLQIPTCSSCSSTALLSRDSVAFCFLFFFCSPVQYHVFFLQYSITFFPSVLFIRSLKTPGWTTDLSTHHRYRRRPLTSLLRIAPQTSLGRSWPLSRRLSSPRLATPHTDTYQRAEGSLRERPDRELRVPSPPLSIVVVFVVVVLPPPQPPPDAAFVHDGSRFVATCKRLVTRERRSLCDSRTRYIIHVRGQQRAHTYARDRTRIHPARRNVYTHTHTRRVKMRTTGRGRRERTERTVAVNTRNFGSATRTVPIRTRRTTTRSRHIRG